MGRDKATLEVGGRAMAERVAGVLREACDGPVVAVGGDRAALEALGLSWVADDHPGEGPLGGLLTALSALDADRVAVLACDLVAPRADTLRALVDALDQDPTAAAALPVGERVRYDQVVIERGARVRLVEAFARGVRSMHEGLAGVVTVEVSGLPAAALADADTPGELGLG